MCKRLRLQSRVVNPSKLFRLTTYLTLAGASIVSTLLVAARWWYSGVPAYFFLIWNLFLAWIPLLLALAAVRLQRRILLFAIMVAVWLLFLPNAPYITTDLLHLGRWSHSGAPPLWVDLLLLLAFSLTGLWLGLTSLGIMQSLVGRRWGQAMGWLFAVVALSLSSLGVYIGRFLRWNSWDVVAQPAGVLADLHAILFNPLANRSAWAFSALFTLMLLSLYVGGPFRHLPASVERLTPGAARARTGPAKTTLRSVMSGRGRGVT